MRARLADICELFVGRPLDKTQCLSDWTRRPLRLAQASSDPARIPRSPIDLKRCDLQKRYAALDAYCILEIFDALRRRTAGDAQAFEDAVAECVRDFCHGYQANRGNANLTDAMPRQLKEHKVI